MNGEAVQLLLILSAGRSRIQLPGDADPVGALVRLLDTEREVQRALGHAAIALMYRDHRTAKLWLDQVVRALEGVSPDDAPRFGVYRLAVEHVLAEVNEVNDERT